MIIVIISNVIFICRERERENKKAPKIELLGQSIYDIVVALNGMYTANIYV